MELHEIQKKLKAPKNQYNKFGNYYHRNCEDILEAVKPLLGDSVLTLSDEIVCVGERYYVKCTARFLCNGQITESFGWAREPINRKGMDESQITGATSSYARKYALCGLFCLDDSKDDPDNKPPVEPQKSQAKPRKPADTTPIQKLYELALKVGVPEKDAELTNALVQYSTEGKLDWDKCKASTEDCRTAYKAIQQADKKFPPDSDKPLILRVQEYKNRRDKK